MAGQTSDAKTIFARALEIEDPAERDAYLQEACGKQPKLRAEVDDLLRAFQQAGSFLEAPAAAAGATEDYRPLAEGPGSRVGRYKLLQQIGEGGFGVVFMAEQVEPVQRKVALKIIKPGMDTKEVIARFEAERQALALMDHPNIAKVFDAGATESGRPYFVMELVRGIPITDYCDQNNLGPRERLELFISVCQAVQHAHQKGIIHRDIKPSNILVTLHDGRPVVKVIDFGVAKAIDRRLTERTLFTRYEQMIGTPLYMSPEQAEMSGLDVDTRTDIYALGVLLYELLTGSTPFDRERLRAAAYDEIRRIIREEEPPKPSTRVSTLGQSATAVSEHRKTEPRKLSALLRGDLDWIVMKSLEKDRTRRYETAKDLADDVEHYLTDQPVEARAPSALYRLRKLVRRYRVAAATVAVVVATLLAATVFSAWMARSEWLARQALLVQKEAADREWRRAEEQAEKARRAAKDAELSLEIIAAALGAGGGKHLGTGEQSVIVVLESLARRLDESTDRNHYVEANLRPVIANAFYGLLKYEQAKVQYRHALDAERLVYGSLDDKTTNTLVCLITTCLMTGDRKEADRYIEELLTAGNALGEREGSLVRARALSLLVESVRQRTTAEEALGVAVKARDLFLKWQGIDSGEYAWATLRLAECRGALGDNEKEVAGFSEALSIFERTADRRSQWEVWTRFGNMYSRLHKPNDARDSFRRAIEVAATLGIVAPQFRHQSTISLSEVLFGLREWQEAERIHRQFLRLEAELNKDDPRLAEHQARLVCALAAQGKDKDAEAIRDEALRGANPESQWQLWTTLGNTLRSQGRLFEAKEAFTQALPLSDRFGADSIERRHQSANALANTACDLRDFITAEAIQRDFIRSVDGQVEKDDRRLFVHRYMLAGALWSQGKEKESDTVNQEILPLIRRAVEESKTLVWAPIIDRMFYADLISATKTDKASLNEALRLLDGVEAQTKQESGKWLQFWWHGVRAEALKRLGQKAEAIRHVGLALEKVAPDDWNTRQFNRECLIRLLRDEGQLGEAEIVLRKALADYQEKLGGDHVLTHYARADLAEFLLVLKKHAEAEELLRQAEKGLLSDARVPASQKERLVGLFVKLYDAWGKPDQAAQWKAKLGSFSKSPSPAAAKP